MQLLHLGTHLHSQFRIEIGQRLVEQENLGIADDRAPHCDTLALATGELPRPARKKILDIEDPRRMLDALSDFTLWPFAINEPERHVFVDRHVRIERVILEDHRDIAVLRRQVVDDAAVDRDRPGCHVLKAGNHPQQSRLPAA